MKLHLITAVGIGLGLACSPANAGNITKLKTEQDKVSYSIGVDMGKTFKSQKIEVKPNVLARGIKDAYAGGKTLLTTKQMQKTLVTFQQSLVKKQEQAITKLSTANGKQGKTFMAKNAKAEGVTSLPSGLQYKVLTPGKGAKPSANDIVTVEYTGKLLDGKVFDSTKNGKPVSFPVHGVIPGWQQALKMMRTGATWELIVPPKLAYGKSGLGGPIGPNETLIFKIHLVSIEKPKMAKITKPALVDHS